MVGLADAFILPGLDAAQGSPFDWLSVARVKAFRDVVALGELRSRAGILKLVH